MANENIYQRLGVRKLINASGTVTILGGSLMPQKVLDTMQEAAGSFVDIRELHTAAGRRIAELTGAEAAHVTCGAAAGIAVAAAACMTDTHQERIKALPDTAGMKSTFVVQRTHRTGFDRSVLLAGGSFVEIEPTTRALKTALADQPAAVFVTQSWMCDGPSIPLATVADHAHAAEVPVIVDAAAEVPPPENLSYFLNEGADLVIFSGGKMIRGPQASGFILGSAERIEACARNDCPNAAIGRGMKCGKEEIAGLVTAVELFVHRDHAADVKEWQRRVQVLVSALQNEPGVELKESIPPGVGQKIPFVQLAGFEDPAAMDAISDNLLNGEPAIAVQVLPAQNDPNRQPRQQQMRIHVHMLQDDEVEIVARRVREEIDRRKTL